MYLSDDGPLVFLVLTCILGGGAALLAGRGLARSWKPFWRIFFYMALLAGAVRFFHYALFNGTLLSPYYYLVIYAVLLTAACLGFRAFRYNSRWSRNIAGSTSARARSPGAIGPKGHLRALALFAYAVDCAPNPVGR